MPGNNEGAARTVADENIVATMKDKAAQCKR